MFTIFIIISLAAVVKTIRYEFIFDNPEIFDKCPQIPGNNGIHDFMDMSEIRFELEEGRINVFGNSTVVWEGVEPSDRIQLRGEVLKYQRGTWQVTPITITANDFCKIQYKPGTFWYQIWTTHIPLNERECVNVKGHTYHMEPFTIDTVSDYPTNIEGRHKAVYEFVAYDQTNQRRSKMICVQIIGELIKVK
ncbi:uncharacterized protein [Musca autumnalis]|uniref:uncharacterized protein n=1 Tax=Musca autumnalis TaxID=221902 RepID=UPI003CFB593E